MKDTTRIRIKSSIILAGEHAEEGTEHEVSKPLANHLIGAGSAEQVLEDGEDPETATSVNRMDSPSNRDPKSKQVAPAPAKEKK